MTQRCLLVRRQPGCHRLVGPDSAGVGRRHRGRTLSRRGHEKMVISAVFSSDGSRITASWDQTARVWDAATGVELVTFRGHEKMVISVAFSADGGRIVTASADGTVRVWDAATGIPTFATLRGHENIVSAAAFLLMAAGSSPPPLTITVRLWDAATGTEIARITLDANVSALATQGPLIGVGDALGRVHVLHG